MFSAINILCDNADLDEAIEQKCDEIEVLTELTKRHIEENARTSCDQKTYQKRYNELLGKYNSLSAAITSLKKTRTERKRKATRLTAFVDTMEQNRQPLQFFNEAL